MTTTEPTTEVSLAEHAGALGDAIHALCDPRWHTVTVEGSARLVSTPSVLDEMLDSVAGIQGVRAGAIERSIAPLWIDGIKWLIEVEDELLVWAKRHQIITCISEFDATRPSLADRFHALARVSWRPQDHAHVGSYATAIERWRATAEQKLTGPAQIPLRNTACPKCGVKHVRRRNEDNYWGNTEAMQVNVDGAWCLNCGAKWNSALFRHLGRVFGCKSPEELAQNR